MNFKNSLKAISKYGKQNSPALLIIAGLVGMGASMVMVNKAAKKSVEVIDKLDEEVTKKDEILAVAPLYLPAALTFTASAACIIGSYKISADRIAGLATAYTITEHKLTEYQQKVIDKFGEEKHEEIQKEIVEDHVREHEEDMNCMGPVEPDGKQWFFDDKSGRPFRASLKEVLDAREAINVRLKYEPVKLNDFYYELGLEEIDALDIYEWAEGDELEIRFQPYMFKDGVTTCPALYYSVPIAADYVCVH